MENNGASSSGHPRGGWGDLCSPPEIIALGKVLNGIHYKGGAGNSAFEKKKRRRILLVKYNPVLNVNSDSEIFGGSR